MVCECAWEREGEREKNIKKKIFFQSAEHFPPSSKEREFEFTLCRQVLGFAPLPSARVSVFYYISQPRESPSALDIVKCLYISPGFISEKCSHFK